MWKRFYFKQFSLAEVHGFNFETVSLQKIQFSISTQFRSIWNIDWILSIVTTPGQSGPGSNGNEGVLQIPQTSSISGSPSSDNLVSYPGN